MISQVDGGLNATLTVLISGLPFARNSALSFAHTPVLQMPLSILPTTLFSARLNMISLRKFSAAAETAHEDGSLSIQDLLMRVLERIAKRMAALDASRAHRAIMRVMTKHSLKCPKTTTKTRTA